MVPPLASRFLRPPLLVPRPADRPGRRRPRPAQVSKPPPPNAPPRGRRRRAFPPLPTAKPAPLAAAAPGPQVARQARRAGRRCRRAATGRAMSTGTGFVVARGRALTNHHVIDGCAARPLPQRRRHRGRGARPRLRPRSATWRCWNCRPRPARRCAFRARRRDPPRRGRGDLWLPAGGAAVLRPDADDGRDLGAGRARRQPAPVSRSARRCSRAIRAGRCSTCAATWSA